MNATTNTPLVIAFAAVVMLFLLFAGGAITGGMGGEMNGGGWMDQRNWMWTPAVLALGLSVVLGWVILKKKE